MAKYEDKVQIMKQKNILKATTKYIDSDREIKKKKKLKRKY